MRINKAFLLTGAAFLIIGGLAGYLLSTYTSGPSEMAGGGGENAGKGQPLFYRAPMNPDVTSPVPAKDEMGMDYVPVYAEDQANAGQPGTVLIDPVTLQDIGVRTAVAKRTAFSHTIRAPGRIAYDEENLSKIHLRTDGWVEKLYISRTGDPVAPGSLLLSLYSPQLVSSQQEYLLALKSWESQKDSPFPDVRKSAEDLLRISKKRLELLDVPASRIKELETTGAITDTVDIRSPFGGTVLSIGVREGQYLTPGTEIYQIADLTRVWVFADVFENELPWAEVGAKASMTLEALPGRVFEGVVDYIYPYLNPETRTARFRLVFDNPDLQLRPDSFSNVVLASTTKQDAIVIPSEALIRTGKRTVVFVVSGPGRFEPREVEAGIMSSQEVEIVSGLQAGEAVVTSGQFLLDSESRLNESLAKMMTQDREKPADAPKGMKDMPETENNGND
jgi:membrane fusion protein, copper/silver efflux system